MSLTRRLSTSYTTEPFSSSVASSRSPITRTKELTNFFQSCSTLAKDIADEEILSEIDADVSVDAACEFLIEKQISCLAVRDSSSQQSPPEVLGLFDCADVNAFLTLAATSHLLNEDDIDDRTSQILEAAKSGTGKVPVHLCTNLSEKNPLVALTPTATTLSLLELFSRGTHRVIIRDANTTKMVSDVGLLIWLMKHANDTALAPTLSQPISALGIGSRDVISCYSSDAVLDAMKIMSEQGLSSVAVTDAEGGDLLSAVSVTDIARLVASSQSKKILSTPLGSFISLIKAPLGSRDGEERYPVFSVSPNSTLSHVIQKLLATNAHRVFITDDPSEPSSPLAGNLRGVVSVVDVLSVFARRSGVPDVDPGRMQRQRRASSASSSSSRSASSSRVSRRSSILSGGHTGIVGNIEREFQNPERKL